MKKRKLQPIREFEVALGVRGGKGTKELLKDKTVRSVLVSKKIISFLGF